DCTRRAAAPMLRSLPACAGSCVEDDAVCLVLAARGSAHPQPRAGASLLRVVPPACVACSATCGYCFVVSSVHVRCSCASSTTRCRAGLGFHNLSSKNNDACAYLYWQTT